MNDKGIERLLVLINVPQGLFKTLSQPPIEPGQFKFPINSHLFNVIDPVSITPTVDNIAIATLAHLEPRSWRRRLFNLADPMQMDSKVD